MSEVRKVDENAKYLVSFSELVSREWLMFGVFVGIILGMNVINQIVVYINNPWLFYVLLGAVALLAIRPIYSTVKYQNFIYKGEPIRKTW